jgi:hypothetical protein
MRVLKPGGSLVTYFPQYALTEVLEKKQTPKTESIVYSNDQRSENDRNSATVGKGIYHKHMPWLTNSKNKNFPDYCSPIVSNI